MELVPIKRTLKENEEFADEIGCQENLPITIQYFDAIGYYPPWIGYYVKEGNLFVGAAAFKGRPVNNKVEIAYGTFEPYQNKGYGAMICKLLVELSLETDPSIEITARTLPEKNYSTRILERNGFELLGNVFDIDDGDVWEWRYIKKD